MGLPSPIIELTPVSLSLNSPNDDENPLMDLYTPSPACPRSRSSSTASDDANIARLLGHPTSVASRMAAAIRALWNGPSEPCDDFPSPFLCLRHAENLPRQLSQTISKRVRVSFLCLYLAIWACAFLSMVAPYLTRAPVMHSQEMFPVVTLGCTDYFGWKGKNAECGLDGVLCEWPLTDVVIRCPALCDRSWTFSYLPVGNQTIKHRGYYIGGGTVDENNRLDHDQLTAPYRADSYPCGAAVHAGLISPFKGGTARISYSAPEQLHYASIPGKYGVTPSIAFDTFFPHSFYFKSVPGKVSESYDPRSAVVATNILLGLPIVYLASGAVVFWTLNIFSFWTIVLILDPPLTVDALSPDQLSELLSLAFARFLPTCFILYVLWHCSVKRTLSSPPPDSNSTESPLKRVLLWYPSFWLGVLNNVTFDRLPVDRLTMDDIRLQPGALITIITIASTIMVCAIIQAYQIWRAGKFRKYIALYLCFIAGIVALSLIPGLTLRLHHYILAMLLIPGCATRGPTALLFQGVLDGLFLAGTARWGLAAIVETASSLLRDDPRGLVKPPAMSYRHETGDLTVLLLDTNSSAFSTISYLINDVERAIMNYTEPLNLPQLFSESRQLKALVENAMRQALAENQTDIILYLRAGFASLRGNDYGDFSRAATLKWPSGEFTPALAGST